MKTEQTLAASNGSAANTALGFRPPGAPGSTTPVVWIESAAPTTTIPGPGFRL